LATVEKIGPSSEASAASQSVRHESLIRDFHSESYAPNSSSSIFPSFKSAALGPVSGVIFTIPDEGRSMYESGDVSLGFFTILKDVS
jgi:hypothetical protein